MRKFAWVMVAIAFSLTSMACVEDDDDSTDSGSEELVLGDGPEAGPVNDSADGEAADDEAADEAPTEEAPDGETPDEEEPVEEAPPVEEPPTTPSSQVGG